MAQVKEKSCTKIKEKYNTDKISIFRDATLHCKSLKDKTYFQFEQTQVSFDYHFRSKCIKMNEQPTLDQIIF